MATMESLCMTAATPCIATCLSASAEAVSKQLAIGLRNECTTRKQHFDHMFM